MDNLILTLHIGVCVLLIILVLLQSGKEGMGVIFGGGSNSMFGGTGAGGLLVKLTTFAGFIFVVTSLSYNIAISKDGGAESQITDIAFEETRPSEPTTPAGISFEETAAPAIGVATNSTTSVVEDAVAASDNATSAIPPVE